MPPEDTEIRISNRAFDRISRARREGESLSDVIIRLSAATLEGLQRRGEMEVTTTEGRKLVISIDQDKCLGAMSCVTLAPSVFSYDKTEAGVWRRRAEPLGMMEVEKGEVSAETLQLAAESCPYKAIILKDAETGEPIVP